MDQRRSHPPIGVSRGSRRILNRTPFTSLMVSRSAFRASASTTMLRNLYTLNGRPSLPIRRWRKRTGPPSEKWIAQATAISSGESRSSADAASVRSKIPFTMRCGPVSLA